MKVLDMRLSEAHNEVVRSVPNFKKSAHTFAARAAAQAALESRIAAGTEKCSCHGCSTEGCSPTGRVVGCSCTEWDPEWDK